jgi:hypothetical protein
MTKTIRRYYKARRGRQVIDIEWGEVNLRSVVVVTAAEWNATPPIYVDTDRPRWVGDANIWVAGIAPRDGGVRFAVTIDWGSPLPFVVDVTLIAPGADEVSYE